MTIKKHVHLALYFQIRQTKTDHFAIFSIFQNFNGNPYLILQFRFFCNGALNSRKGHIKFQNLYKFDIKGELHSNGKTLL